MGPSSAWPWGNDPSVERAQGGESHVLVSAWQCDGAQLFKPLGFTQVWAWGSGGRYFRNRAGSMALCLSSQADQGCRWIEEGRGVRAGGKKGLWFGGSCLTPLGPGSGFQTRKQPRVCKYVCTFTHSPVWGWGVRAHTPFHLLLLFSVMLTPAPQPWWQVACVSANGPSCFACPCLFFSPKPVSLLPLPCPLLPVSHHFSAAPLLPQSPLSSLCAHPDLTAFFVTSVGPLSPVPWRPWVSLAPAG